MTLLEKQLLIVRKLRQSSNKSSAYFYLSPVLNSKVIIQKNRKCVLNRREKQQKG